MWPINGKCGNAPARRIDESPSDLGVRVIPVGDAFWRINSDPKWSYKPDATYDFKNPMYPMLPEQTNSIACRLSLGC